MENILLGVSGGIAAYKSPDLVRRLTERGADVRVVMTDSARRFVSPLTMQAVSGNEVRSELWDDKAEAAMGHIELARWADRILIAPATANTIARLANGLAGDLLSSVCLASTAPLTLAPAMNTMMWQHAATRANCTSLAERGVAFIGPAEGDQACGETGPGRMTEPLEIAKLFMAGTATQALRGLTVMITAGPTREPIDPVRYITNRSSGKMGYAIAQAARDAGADVRLVSGPVALTAPAGVDHISVQSAEDMYNAVHENLAGVDIFIGAAAIADYAPASSSPRKIKKKNESTSIEMLPSKDTLASVSAKPNAPFVVGFAAETDHLRDYALEKLTSKNLDMIIANQVGEGLAFDRSDNAVSVFWPGGEKEYPLMHKQLLARDLITLIAERFSQRSVGGKLRA